MRRLVALVALVWVSVATAADSVRLHISVMQLYSSKAAGKPFSNVGLFELRRGDSRYERATCPDLSDKSGAVVCTIMCDAKESDRIPLRVIPPKNKTTRGYTVPVAEEVALVGCSLSASSKRFTYKDSYHLLAEVFSSYPDLAGLTVQRAGTVTIEPFTPQTAVYFRKLVRTRQGFEAIDLTKTYAAEVAIAKEEAGDKDSAKAFAQYSFAASNVILEEVYRTHITSADSSKMKLSGNKIDFYSNLSVLGADLEAKPNKNQQDIRLLNDIHELRNQSSSMIPYRSFRNYAVKPQDSLKLRK